MTNDNSETSTHTPEFHQPTPKDRYLRTLIDLRHEFGRKHEWFRDGLTELADNTPASEQSLDARKTAVVDGLFQVICTIGEVGMVPFTVASAITDLVGKNAPTLDQAVAAQGAKIADYTKAVNSNKMRWDQVVAAASPQSKSKHL